MHEILLPTNRLTRIANSYRYPFQAALAARTPLINQRVPMRAYWQRQPLAATRAAEQYIGSMLGRRREMGWMCSNIARWATDARQSTMRTRTRFGDDGGYPMRVTMPRVLAGIAIGALGMYYLDPREGRRRRALVRDQFAHGRHVLTRDIPETIEKRGRFLRGKVRGIGHEAAELIRINGHHEPVDDETLVDRVRSEVLRDNRFKAGEINIDAYHGSVTLRGQMQPDDARRLLHAVKDVDGVRQVRSYLHPPGTLPPNKAEVYEKERVPGMQRA